MTTSTPSATVPPTRTSPSDGEVDAGERLLECWKHGSQFSLITGEPLQMPALKPTPVYRVEIRAGEVHLTLP